MTAAERIVRAVLMHGPGWMLLTGIMAAGSHLTDSPHAWWLIGLAWILGPLGDRWERTVRDGWPDR